MRHMRKQSGKPDLKKLADSGQNCFQCSRIFTQSAVTALAYNASRIILDAI
jgi:hypothetical protein